jgi:hypothetical protein
MPIRKDSYRQINTRATGVQAACLLGKSRFFSFVVPVSKRQKPLHACRRLEQRVPVGSVLADDRRRRVNSLKHVPRQCHRRGERKIPF